jgi:gag-polypeptide of LTR copia-type
MADNQIARKRHAPILSRNNWETWFKLLELYFSGESIDFVLQQTEAEHAWIQGGVLTPSSVTNVKDNTPDKSTGCWNINKRAKYKAASNKVLYEIVICIDETDKEYIKDFSSAKEVWEGLRAKYSKIRPQTVREDLKKLANYQLSSDTLVEDAWTELRQIRRRIGIANPAKMKAITDMELFEYLLGGLPDQYSTTRAALDAQISLDVHEKLLVLQNHQDQLRAANATTANATATTSTPTETKALVAKGDSRLTSPRRERSRHRSTESATSRHRSTERARSRCRSTERVKGDSRPTSPGHKRSRRRSTEQTCYLCSSERHQVRDCELWEGLAAVARREIRRAQNQKPRKGSRQPSTKNEEEC